MDSDSWFMEMSLPGKLIHEKGDVVLPNWFAMCFRIPVFFRICLFCCDDAWNVNDLGCLSCDCFNDNGWPPVLTRIMIMTNNCKNHDKDKESQDLLLQMIIYSIFLLLMRRRVVVIRTMMMVVAVVIECCHACTTKAAWKFHKWWILSLWSSILQSNKLRTDKTETSHQIPFSNVCFTHLSSNLILKNNHLWYEFSWTESYTLQYPKFSHVFPWFLWT